MTVGRLDHLAASGHRLCAFISVQVDPNYRFLAKSDNMLHGLETVGEPIASLLAANRITPQRVAAVCAQVEAAYTAISTRGDAMGAEATSVIAMQRVQDLAVISDANLRKVGRMVFPDPVADRDARLNMELDPPIPGSIMLFIGRGRGGLAKAKQESQATRLAAAGFDEERIDEMLALLTVLEQLYGARREARQAAKDETVARDATSPRLGRPCASCATRWRPSCARIPAWTRRPISSGQPAPRPGG